ncbi:MAG: diguanylate cyclase domain-containing protein, partial [Gemmatimonadaceae bacterium]
MSIARLKILAISAIAEDVRRLHETLAHDPSHEIELHDARVLKQALRQLRETRFDAVLLHLPADREPSLSALATLLEQASDVPVVVLTERDDEELGVLALKAGAQDALCKEPLDGGLVARAIRFAIERHQLHVALHAMALLDDLTGLYNRRGFQALGKQQMKIADRTRKRLSHLFVDVDGLKSINDRFGHREGDLMLLETAELLRNTFRESDLIARIGGDEFLVLAMDVGSPSQEQWTARLEEQLRSHNARPARRYPLSLSLGFAYYDPEFPCALSDLLDRADTLMYEQKRRKRRLSPLG